MSVLDPLPDAVVPQTSDTSTSTQSTRTAARTQGTEATPQGSATEVANVQVGFLLFTLLSTDLFVSLYH